MLKKFKLKTFFSALIISMMVPTSTFASTNDINTKKVQSDVSTPNVKQKNDSSTLTILPDSTTSFSTQKAVPLGAGEWDYLGYDPVPLYNYTTVNTRNFNSGGGGFKIRVDGVADYNSYSVQLMEYDPDNPDDPIGTTRRGYGNYQVFEWSEIKTDGDNGKAELYIKIGNATDYDSSVNVLVWD
ncbi:hypothetical protein GMB86_12650 [Terrilactibacillus sp. BCM23-1]|uniref:Secreted protein n=1 Tax=Terrilactibacillus tamarindi TaxID=2599694 RepID=A0A6N8CUR3_9BACI|nr:hypothetical protein [Terrilactibacillus tamarindi]MTT32855.1 hypothetical protein [Terrilactibacillus tamarindi]